MKLLFILLLSIVSQTNAQYETPEIAPDVGWERFKSMIVYPEIAKRAGIQGYVDVAILSDTLGGFGEIQIVGHQIFHQPIKDAIRKVNWKHKDNRSFNNYEAVYFTVEFKLKPYEMPRRNILRIEVDKPIIRIDH